MAHAVESKFTAAVNAMRDGDERSYIPLLKHLTAAWETRETDYDAGIFNGFLLIHYACYFKEARALELLLPSQYSAGTKAAVLVPSHYVSSDAKLAMSEHTNALFVCLFSDFLEGAKMIIEFWRGKGKVFDCVSHYGETVLHYAAVHHNITSTYLLQERYLMNQWSVEDQFPEHFTFVALLAYAGRDDVFEQMLTLLHGDISMYADRIAFAMLFIDGDDCNMVQICEKPIEELEKYHTTEEARLSCQRTVKRTLIMACKYIKRRCNKELDFQLSLWFSDAKLRRQLSEYVRDVRTRQFSRMQLFDQLIDSSFESSFSEE